MQGLLPQPCLQLPNNCYSQKDLNSPTKYPLFECIVAPASSLVLTGCSPCSLWISNPGRVVVIQAGHRSYSTYIIRPHLSLTTSAGASWRNCQAHLSYLAGSGLRKGKLNTRPAGNTELEGRVVKGEARQQPAAIRRRLI